MVSRPHSAVFTIVPGINKLTHQQKDRSGRVTITVANAEPHVVASVRLLARFLGSDIKVVQVDSLGRIDVPPGHAVSRRGDTIHPAGTLRDGAFRNIDLTHRQREVLDCVMQGLTNKEIARVLGISPATVRTNVSSLMRSMGVTSRTAAATLAAKLAQGDPR